YAIIVNAGAEGRSVTEGRNTNRAVANVDCVVAAIVNPATVVGGVIIKRAIADVYRAASTVGNPAAERVRAKISPKVGPPSGLVVFKHAVSQADDARIIILNAAAQIIRLAKDGTICDRHSRNRSHSASRDVKNAKLKQRRTHRRPVGRVALHG